MLSDTPIIASKMPTVTVMDLAMSSPAQQPHPSFLQCVDRGRDIAGQVSHLQRHCGSITLLDSPGPQDYDEERGFRDIKPHSWGHIAG